MKVSANFTQYVGIFFFICAIHAEMMPEYVRRFFDFDLPTNLTKLDCMPGEFRCKNEECVPAESRCNGYSDCQDNSDENDCIEAPKESTTFAQNRRKPKHCSLGEFKCRDESECIPDRFLCDEDYDCADKSDELDCDGYQHDTRNCTLFNRKYLCSDGKKCIDFLKVCDDKKNCQDGSDEGGRCAAYPVRCNNCSLDCVASPRGPQCVCPMGMQSFFNNETCHDINECARYGACDQSCENIEGSYRCNCELGYRLQPDHHTCKVSSGEGLILYSSLKEIKGMYLNSLSNHTIAENLQHTTGVTSDKQYIYWTIIHEGAQAIVKSTPDGHTQDMIVTSGLGTPEDLAVDWITGNVYFTDSSMKHIGVCNNDGSHCAILHNKDIDKPRAVALSPLHGMMYWSDWGATPLIASSCMDGTNAKELVTTNLHWPNGITVDIPAERLYYVDAKFQSIETIKLDGSDRLTVLSHSVNHPFSIAVFENTLYWSDWENKELLSCNKFTGKDRKVLVKERKRIYGIHVFHPALQATANNPCIQSSCSHMCLLKPPASKDTNIRHTCACPKGKSLRGDNKTCTQSDTEGYILLGFKNRLYTIEPKRLGREKTVEIYLENKVSTISALAYDTIDGSVIISDTIQQKIFSYHLRTGNLGVVVARGLGQVRIMKFDELSNNLYWCDWQSSTVEVYSMTTFTRMVLISGSSLVETPVAMEVVPEDGILFVAFVSTSGHVHIDKLNMDGTGRQVMVQNNLTGPEIILHYDEKSKKLFWVDTVAGVIESINLEGSERKLFSQVSGSYSDHPTSLTSLRGDLYWVTRNSPLLRWQSIDEKTGVDVLKLNINSYANSEDELKIVTVRNKVDRVVQNFGCHNNGNCSHICLFSQSKRKVCACPSGYALSLDKETCVGMKACNSKQYQCHTGECIAVTKVCDKYYDCPRGDDEDLATCSRVFNLECPKGQFLCLDRSRCINKSQRCDGRKDCADGSDEVCQNTCNNGKFLCESGKCISEELICNGVSNCPHGDDELNCEVRNCTKTQFRCTSGQCIPQMWRCDGERDCYDFSDETEECAVNKCKSDEFRCQNGRCIFRSFKCNGYDDCGDRSDEGSFCETKYLNHPTFYYVTAEDRNHNHRDCNTRTHFHCDTNSTEHCLPLAMRCDGIPNCVNAEDERNCGVSEGCPHPNDFLCSEATNHCIPESWVCDFHLDCENGRDEDANLCNSTTHVDRCRGFQCADGGCIPYTRVCDSFADCGDESDEGHLCGDFSCDQRGCSHTCQTFPKVGAKCICPEGYELKNDNKTCVDVNECLANICSQNCTNLEGSFECFCSHREYHLRQDGISCKAEGGSPQFVIASEHDATIFGNNLQHSTLIYNVQNGPQIMSLDVDAGRSFAYLTLQTGTLVKASTLSYDDKHMVNGLEMPTKVTADWITGNVFFVEAFTKISVCNFDERKCATIYDNGQKGGYTISSLAIDAAAGYIFWSEVRFTEHLHPEGVIKRSQCDGNHVKDIVKNIRTYIKNVVVDSINGHLFWLNRANHTVDRVDYNGSGFQSVQQVESNTVSFSIFENSLYWVTSGNHGSSYPIKMCRLHGPMPRKCQLIQVYTPLVSHFTILQINRQRMVKNPCSRNNCSNICVVTPEGRNCVCPNRMIEIEGQGCPNLSDPKSVLLSKTNNLLTKISSSNTSTSNSSTKYEHQLSSSFGYARTIFFYTVLIIIICVIGTMMYRKYLKPGSFRNRLNLQNLRSGLNPLYEAHEKEMSRVVFEIPPSAQPNSHGAAAPECSKQRVILNSSRLDSVTSDCDFAHGSYQNAPLIK